MGGVFLTGPAGWIYSFRVVVCQNQARERVQNIKKRKTHLKHVFSNFQNFSFSKFSPLEVVSHHFGPQHRILQPQIPPGTSSEVCTPEFYVKNDERYFFVI